MDRLIITDRKATGAKITLQYNNGVENVFSEHVTLPLKQF